MAEKQKLKKNKEFIVHCIHLYRELPALWNVKSKEYHDRDKKNIAYETLLGKYKEMYPDATKDDVKKKFNSLRMNYRKELKKHLQSMKSGSSTDDIYEPSLWYYKEIVFLQQYECAADSESTMDKLQSTTEENSRKIDAIDENNKTQESTTTTDTLSQSAPLTASRKNKNLKKKKEDEVLELAAKRLRQKPDEYEHWALSCAIDLKKMEPTQQIFAKNAIAAIIMEGQLGLLQRNSVKINESINITTPTHCSSTPTPIQYSSTPSPQYDFAVPYNHNSEHNINYSQEQNVETLTDYISSFQDQ